MFISFAEKATSERMQKHWAGVLAGEIRQPGTFSFAALQILSVMDQALANKVAVAKSWIWQSVVPITKSLELGENYKTLLALDAAGILRLGHTQYYNQTGVLGLYGIAGYTISVRTEYQFKFKAAILTEAGEQVFSLAPLSVRNRRHADEMIDLLREVGAQGTIVD
jgi:hypothetical protein